MLVGFVEVLYAVILLLFSSALCIVFILRDAVSFFVVQLVSAAIGMLLILTARSSSDGLVV
jgi:hypothetical protein